MKEDKTTRHIAASIASEKAKIQVLKDRAAALVKKVKAIDAECESRETVIATLEGLLPKE